MGLVTDIYWRCPFCSTLNQAQVYGEWEDPESFPIDAVPASRKLKWNPPCEKCKKYKLDEPQEALKRLLIVEATNE